jgi:hypothetical protein
MLVDQLTYMKQFYINSCNKQNIEVCDFCWSNLPFFGNVFVLCRFITVYIQNFTPSSQTHSREAPNQIELSATWVTPNGKSSDEVVLPMPVWLGPHMNLDFSPF